MNLQLLTTHTVEGVYIDARWTKGGEVFRAHRLVTTETLVRRGYAHETYYLNQARNALTAQAIKHYYGE